MGNVIPVPRFQGDLDREATEAHIVRRLRDLAVMSTPEQFTRFWHGLSRVALETGKRLPGNINPPPDAEAG